jgi:hypothetical protein
VEKSIIESIKWSEALPAMCQQSQADDPGVTLTRIARALPEVIALRVGRSNDPIRVVELSLPAYLTFADNEREYKLTRVIFMPSPFHWGAILGETNRSWVTHYDQLVQLYPNSSTTQIWAQTVIALYSRGYKTALSGREKYFHRCEIRRL